MVVRMRANRAHTANRRSHHALEAVRLSKCVDCGAAHVRHQACPTCGKYRGRVVINVHAAVEKKAKKAKTTEGKAK
jgi:large subunit ribosomal protein L32